MACKDIPLTKNKSLEIQLELFSSLSKDTIFEFNLNWTLKQDHAGPRFQLTIFRILYFHIIIYDHRHYDWENDCWEKYE